MRSACLPLPTNEIYWNFNPEPTKARVYFSNKYSAVAEVVGAKE